MPAPTNPFPGMNPYLQTSWSDVHGSLIGYIRDALGESLPMDLTVRSEERLVVSSDEDTQVYRPDIAVIEPWHLNLPPVAALNDAAGGTTALAVADPLLFTATPGPERWLGIHNTNGDLITALEVLSPSNKTEPGRHAYLNRQQPFLAGGVHLVEIDLVRGGVHTVGVERHLVPFPVGTCHLVCVTRMIDDYRARWEVYLCPLRDPLPVIRVPLRRGEPDVPLALQPLIDRCYRTGRYWLSDVSGPPQPAIADKAEIAWIDERLRAGGLR